MKNINSIFAHLIVITLLLSPLAEAKGITEQQNKRILGEQAQNFYQLAVNQFRKRGHKGFADVLSTSKLYSEEDLAQFKKWIGTSSNFPQMIAQENGTLLITVKKGQGINEKIVLEIGNIEKNEFLVNGKKIIGEISVVKNYNNIREVLQKRTASIDLSIFLIPSANASGISTTTLVVGALVVVAAGVITYMILKNKKNKSSNSNANSGPEIGDPTVIHEETTH